MLPKLWSRLAGPKDPFAAYSRRRGWHRWARVVIVVVIVLLTVRMVWGFMAAKNVKAALARARQAGLPLRMTEAPLPTAAPGQDAWPLYAELIRQAGQRGVGMAPALQAQAKEAPLSQADQARLAGATADEELLKTWDAAEAPDAAWKQRFAERLSANQDLLDLLARTAEHPAIRWSVREDPYQPLEAAPRPLMVLTWQTLARASQGFDDGRQEQALADLGVVFRVCHHLRLSPVIEMHAVEAELLLQATTWLQRVLPSLDVPPASLREPARMIAGGPPTPALRTATTFAVARLHAGYLAGVAGARGVGARVQVAALRPYFDASYAKALDFLVQAVPEIDGPYCRFIVPLEERAGRAGSGATAQWAKATAQGVLGAAHSGAIAEALRAQTRLALALRAWQLEHGRLPGTLAELGDSPLLDEQDLGALTTDVFTGGTMGYVSDGPAPRLYAAGLDRHDNGGAGNRAEDLLGQKEHDLCFYLAGLPASSVPPYRPLAAATAPTTAPATAP